VNVFFISADGCLDCKRMRSYLEEISQEFNIDIIELNSETDEAIDFAVENGIEDIPACVIGNTVMFGKNGFSKDLIRKAILKNE
jgi:glutaredoxin